MFSIFKAYCFEFSILILWYLLYQFVLLFWPPNFFHISTKFYMQLIKNNQSLLALSIVDYFLEWILWSFPLFQLTILLLEPCFFLVRYAQPHAEVCKNCLLSVDWICISRLWLVFVLRMCHDQLTNINIGLLALPRKITSGYARKWQSLFWPRPAITAKKRE